LTKGCILRLNSGPKQQETEKVKITAAFSGSVFGNTQPVYPPIAKAARISGTVVLEATVSRTGIISNLRAISGPPLLQTESLKAVRTWRYRPPVFKGVPAEAKATINVVFSLAEDGTATAKATTGDFNPFEAATQTDDVKPPESK
jgi:protein TonB